MGNLLTEGILGFIKTTATTPSGEKVKVSMADKYALNKIAASQEDHKAVYTYIEEKYGSLWKCFKPFSEANMKARALYTEIDACNIGNNTTLGRMYVHGEDFKTAFNNSAIVKANGGSSKGLPKDVPVVKPDFLDNLYK